MEDFYSLVLDCIRFVQDRVQGKNSSKLQLNRHQCTYLAKELSRVLHSLQGRGLQNLHLVQDCRMRILVHLHGTVKRAQILVESCCCQNSSWLAAAMTLGDFKEQVAGIVLDLHQWAITSLDIAFASVDKGSSCGYKIVNILKRGQIHHQKLLKNIHSTQHELQIAALQDREELLKRVTDFLKTKNPKKGGRHDYIRGVYLKSKLNHSECDLESVDELKAYIISGILGSGASGIVQRVNWLGEEVALKQLKYVDETEAPILRQVQHPNVIPILHHWDSFSEDHGSHSFILMELMPRNLQKHIETIMIKKTSFKSSCNMPFLMPVAIDTMLQVAEAMRHLHDRKLTHRDLKPSNILVKLVDKSMMELHNDGYLEVKLADFGSAKAYTNSSTSTPLTRKTGTKVYGAPEIFGKEEIPRDKDFPQKADIWSFGMTSYEILSGKPPFERENLLTLDKRISDQFCLEIVQNI